MMEVDEIENSCWQHLPPVILTEIFSNLSLSERFCAALVCRAWAEAFYAPQIWRSFTFQFEGSSFLPSYDHKAIEFANRFGQHVRKLEISCRRTSHSGCRRVHKKIISFFTSLRYKTQLTELSIRDFHFKRDWHYESAREKGISSIHQFLKTQRRISILDLKAMDVRIESAIQILQSVVLNCSGTVKILLLQDFISPREEVLRNNQFKQIMNEWKCLHSISLNYSMLDNDLLAILIKNNSKSLKTLAIKCRKRERHGHVISNFVWMNALKLCPDLKISLIIERIPKFNEIQHLLQKNIPLQNIRFWTGYENGDEYDDEYCGLTEFLTYLKAYFANTLETLVFDIEGHLEFVDNALVDLVSTCPKLSKIEINAVLRLSTVEKLCSVITGPKSEVRKLHLSLTVLAEKDIIRLHNIEAKHLSKILEKNIDFKYRTIML